MTYSTYAPTQYTQTQPMPAAAPPVVFHDPRVGGDGPTPSIRHFAGRVVALIPTNYNPAAENYDKTGTVEQVTFTAIVVDGGPLEYGDDMTKGTPPTLRVETPCEIAGCMTANTNIVMSLRPHVGTGGAVIGRVVRSDVGRRPWNLVPLDPNDPVRAVLADYFGRRAAGAVTNPTPQPINGGPQPRSQANGQLAAAQQYAQTPPPQVQYAPPVPQPAPASAPPAAVAPPPPPPPPGWPAEAWAQVVASGQWQQFAAPAASAAGY